jgi:hypothetical protein
VFGVTSRKIREKLINELVKALQIARAGEISQVQLKHMDAASTTTSSKVDALKCRGEHDKHSTTAYTSRNKHWVRTVVNVAGNTKRTIALQKVRSVTHVQS